LIGKNRNIANFYLVDFHTVSSGGVKLEKVNSFGGIFESEAKNRDKTDLIDMQLIAKF